MSAARLCRAVCRGFLLLWVGLTVAGLAAASVGMLRDPGFIMGLGLIETHGPAGLLVTIPAMVVPLAGLALLFRARRTGVALLVLWSAVFFLSLLGDAARMWLAGQIGTGEDLAIVLIALGFAAAAACALAEFCSPGEHLSSRSSGRKIGS